MPGQLRGRAAGPCAYDTMIPRGTRVSWEYRGRSCPPTGAGPSRKDVAAMVSPAARLAAPQPAAEAIPPGRDSLLTPCDATASGSEAAQVRLARGAFLLDFCGHHFSLYEFELAAGGWRVTADNRGHLS